jgi:HAD superfamily hydrolase (TIGR01459 family)
MQHLPGFAPLAARYDGFILDLWGVIHDGVKPYPGAVEVLEQLHAAGKPFAMLSNAPRRAHVTRAGMRGMGIPDHLTTRIMTSGEATHRLLRDRPTGFAQALGSRMYHLGPERDRNVYEGVELAQVASPAEASFVLNTGPDDADGPTELADWEATLAACRAAGLPMVCANPDLEVIRGGTRVICAGSLAQRYEAMGGTCLWLGKPDPGIYPAALALLDLPRDRVLAVGDALRTDIAGGHAAGIDTCWVLGGIHAAELGNDPERIAAAASAAGLTPVAALPAFVW